MTIGPTASTSGFSAALPLPSLCVWTAPADVSATAFMKNRGLALSGSTCFLRNSMPFASSFLRRSNPFLRSTSTCSQMGHGLPMPLGHITNFD